MAGKFNLSTERMFRNEKNEVTGSGVALMEGYKKMWIALFGPDSQAEFDALISQALTGKDASGKEIDGEFFGKAVKTKLKELHGSELEQNGEHVVRAREEVEAEEAKKTAGTPDYKPMPEEKKNKEIKNRAESFFMQKRAQEGLESAKSTNSNVSSALNPTEKDKEVEMSNILAEAALYSMAGDGYIPYDTVITAAYEVANGKNLQMECGGGKTTVLYMASLIQAKLLKKQDFLTSSTADLAKQSYDETVHKYDGAGLQSVSYISQEKAILPKKDANGAFVRDKNGKLELQTYDLKGMDPAEAAKILKEAYSQQIVIADNATVMQHQMAGHIPAETTFEGGRNLLADEADYVLQDQFQAVEQLGDELPPDVAKDRAQYREVARLVVENVKSAHSESNPLYVVNDHSQYVDFNEAGNKVVAERINLIAEKYPNIDKQQLADFVYDALVAETLYKENREFQFDKDPKTGETKIISVHRASGTAIDLPQGIEQALYFKHKNDHPDLVQPTEHQVLKSITVESVYGQLFGRQRQSISGTLGVRNSEKETQKTAEGTLEEGEKRDYIGDELRRNGLTEENTYDGSPRQGNKLKRAPINVFETKEEMMDFCVQEAILAANGGVPDGLPMEEGEQSGKRPALLNVDTAEEVRAAAAKIREQDSSLRVLEYTATSEHEFQADKLEAQKSPEAAKQFSEKYGVSHEDGNCRDFQTFIKKCAGSGKTVIVGTGIIGRGTNVKLLGDSNENGGIHVVISGTRDTSSRDPQQIEKRAARGSDNGSVRETICLADMPEDLREQYKAGQITAEQLKESFYERVDERQAVVRTNTYELDKALQENMQSMIDALSLSNVPQERIVEACAMLTERARVIQFRAEGNTDLDRHKAYAHQIQVFGNMYTAKYKEKEPGKFQEKDYLARQDPAMADTYMAFSESKKQMIIKHFKGESLERESLVRMIKGANLNLEDVRDLLAQVQPQAQAVRTSPEAELGEMGE